MFFIAPFSLPIHALQLLLLVLLFYPLFLLPLLLLDSQVSQVFPVYLVFPLRASLAYEARTTSLQQWSPCLVSGLPTFFLLPCILVCRHFLHTVFPAECPGDYLDLTYLPFMACHLTFTCMEIVDLGLWTWCLLKCCLQASLETAEVADSVFPRACTTLTFLSLSLSLFLFPKVYPDNFLGIQLLALHLLK